MPTGKAAANIRKKKKNDIRQQRIFFEKIFRKKNNSCTLKQFQPRYSGK